MARCQERVSAVLPTAWVRSVFTLLSAQPGGLHASLPYSHLLLLSSALLIRRTERALFEVASMTLHWPISISLSNKTHSTAHPSPRTHTHTKHPSEYVCGLISQERKEMESREHNGSNWAFRPKSRGWEPASPEDPWQRAAHSQASPLQACRSEGSWLQLLLPSGSSSTTMADICSSEVQTSYAGFGESERSMSGKWRCGWSRLMVTEAPGTPHRGRCFTWPDLQRGCSRGLISIPSAGCWMCPVSHHQLIGKENGWAQEMGRQKERKLSGAGQRWMDGWMGGWMGRKMDGWIRVGLAISARTCTDHASLTSLEK